jgi:hypothetical protein
MAGTVFVFAGPSVPQASRERYARWVTFLPPVAAGDLVRLDVRPGDTVGLIDGYFARRPAVRHKEILALLDTGFAVHGAASMGALRAAELADFGMVGHGRIFADYLNGTIVADDEVALVHGTEDDDYRAYTEALVNIRYALGDAFANGTLPQRTATAVLREAGRLPYLERTADNLAALVRSMGLDVAEAAHAERAIRHAPDIKQADALVLLESLSGLANASGRQSPPSGRNRWRLRQTAYLRSWQAQARGVPEADLGLLADPQIHDLCRVLAADYPAFREHVGQRAVAGALAASLGLPAGNNAGQSHPQGQDVDPARAAQRRIDEQHARLQALRIHMGLQAAPEGEFLAQAVALRLRHLGLLGPAAQADAGLDRWCTEAEQSLPPAERTAKAAARVLFTDTALAFEDPFVDALYASGVHAAARARLAACLRFHRQLQMRHPFQLYQLRSDNIVQWFQRRWSTDNLEEALVRRGFSDIDAFVSRARHYYLYDKAHANLPPLVLQGP